MEEGSQSESVGGYPDTLLDLRHPDQAGAEMDQTKPTIIYDS